MKRPPEKERAPAPNRDSHTNIEQADSTAPPLSQLGKPLCVHPYFDGFPEELKELHQWVVWRFEKRDGKPTKPPFNVKTGEYVSTNNAETWASYADAVAAYGAPSGAFTALEPSSRISFDQSAEKASGNSPEAKNRQKHPLLEGGGQHTSVLCVGRGYPCQNA